MFAAKRTASVEILARRYQPPTPTFSSSHGPTGSVSRTSVVKFTATYDHAVSSVTGADFNVASTTPGVSWTEAVAASADDKTWELFVSVASGFGATNFSVSTPRNSGSISPPNAAGTNNGFHIQCRPNLSLP